MRIERATQAGTCRSCGAAIEWATEAGSERRHPFNPPIVTVATIPALFDDDPTLEVDLRNTVSHFATCPGAHLWRRRRAAAAR